MTEPVRVPPRGDDPDVWPFNDAGYQDAKDRVVARDAGREYLTVDEKWQLASRVNAARDRQMVLDQARLPT